MNEYIKKEDLRHELAAKELYSESIKSVIDNMTAENVIEVLAQSDIDKAKEWLNSLLKCDACITTIEKEIAYWGKKKNAVNAHNRIKELELNIQKIIDYKLKATKLIDKLTDYIGRAIFTRRYILCEKWDDIADALGGMSTRNVRYIYNETLIEFVKLWKEEIVNEDLGG